MAPSSPKAALPRRPRLRTRLANSRRSSIETMPSCNECSSADRCLNASTDPPRSKRVRAGDVRRVPSARNDTSSSSKSRVRWIRAPRGRPRKETGTRISSWSRVAVRIPHSRAAVECDRAPLGARCDSKAARSSNAHGVERVRQTPYSWWVMWLDNTSDWI